jgi:hypothetical protein
LAVLLSNIYREEHPRLSFIPAKYYGREVDILETFKLCGFYNEKRGAFLFRVFETWVAASFETRTVEVTTYCFPESPHKNTTDHDWHWGVPLPPNSSTERKAGPSKISNAD